MKRSLMVICSVLLLFSSIISFGAVPSPSKAAVTVSYIDTSKSTYNDKLVMMVDGEPFYHSGIQHRGDMLKYNLGWTDEELKAELKMISEDGFTVVNVPIWWSMVEPSKDNFDWTELNKFIDWCEEFNMKFELLWFSHESTGHSISYRLPDYVKNDYQYVLKSDGTRLTRNGHYLLDKTDPNLLAREKVVLGQVMSHLASYDTNHTTIGIQITNEPNVANMQWGASSDRSYSTYSNDLWNNGGYTEAAQFRKDVLLNYLNELGKVVKQSDYSVYTRVNVVGDAEPITENEDLKAQGLSYIDLFGDDPYSTSNDLLYNYGKDGFWAQGTNFPMIMENYGGHASTDIHKFNAIAGNTVYNLYGATDPYDADGSSSNHALYDYDPDTHVVTRKAVTFKVANLNHMLNKISRDIATKSPVERGGSKLQTFNRNATTEVTNITKPLNRLDVTFTTTSGGQGIAVQRSASEFALLSTQATTYTLPGSYGVVGTVEAGHYDSNDVWVSTGSKAYDTSTGDIVINLNAGECVRVLFSSVNLTEIVSGATYKIKHADSGKYLDTDADGVVSLAANTTYDDQDWIVTQDASGDWTIENVRTGRYYLDTEPSNIVIWNTGGTIYDDALWSFEETTDGYRRINNKKTDRDYLYGTTADEVRWNTGSTDSSTVWIFEPK